MEHLPKIDLAGDLFFADITHGGLRDSRHPNNMILFNSMTNNFDVRHTRRYRFFYDSDNRSLFPLSAVTNPLPKHVHYLEINNEMMLDSIATERKILSGMLVPDLNARPDKYHAARVIPRIDFYGTDFFIQTPLRRFTEVGNDNNIISFEHIKTSDEGQPILVYNPDIKNWAGFSNVWPKKGIIEIPLHAISKLDPIGYKILTGQNIGYLKEDRDWLANIETKMNLKTLARPNVLRASPFKNNGMGQ